MIRVSEMNTGICPRQIEVLGIASLVDGFTSQSIFNMASHVQGTWLASGLSWLECVRTVKMRGSRCGVQLG